MASLHAPPDHGEQRVDLPDVDVVLAGLPRDVHEGQERSIGARARAVVGSVWNLVASNLVEASRIQGVASYGVVSVRDKPAYEAVFPRGPFCALKRRELLAGAAALGLTVSALAAGARRPFRLGLFPHSYEPWLTWARERVQPLRAIATLCCGLGARLAADLHYVGASANVVIFARVIEPALRLAAPGAMAFVVTKALAADLVRLKVD